MGDKTVYPMTFDGRFGQDLLVQRKKLIHDFIQIWYSMYIIIIYLMKNVSELYTGFNWDDGIFTKNQLKHTASNNEFKQAFFNIPLIVQYDEKHSNVEQRYSISILDQTDASRFLKEMYPINRNLRCS